MNHPSDVVLLDGGMGQELVRRTRQPLTPLWSTTVLRDDPDLVAELHTDYIRAHARVVTLSNYTATPMRLSACGLAQEFDELHAAAIALAQRGVTMAAADHPVAIAGCLPPLVSSYHAEDVPSEDLCSRDYARLVQAQQAGVEMFMCETLSTVLEVTAATRAGRASGKPVWVSMTVDDHDGTRLRSGQTLASGVEAAIAEGAQAVLVNCAWPEAVTQGMAVLRDYGIPFGGYANGFTHAAALKKGDTVAALSKREDLTPEVYAQHAMGWIDMGARIVGGCCEVGPAHIKHLGQTLLDAGVSLTHRL
jgi:S-methylmethionine-dependent homocysteine/selenocysteine methylase